MNPKGLAANRRMKKGRRAAVIPLGEVIRRPQRSGGDVGVSDWVKTSDSKHSRRTFSPDVFNILELYVIFCQIEAKFEKKAEEEFAKAQF